MSDVSNGGSRPRLLDLFCGAGGAAMGYHRAGFEVVGVDIKPQPNYPFEFVLGDALEFVAAFSRELPGGWGRPIEQYAAIHASPPCQAYTVANNIWQREHPDLVGVTLPHGGTMIGKAPPPVRVQLCGLSMGLNVKPRRRLASRLQRHRVLERSSGHVLDDVRKACCLQQFSLGHTVLERSKQIDRNTPSGGPRFRRKHVGTDRGREAMGIDWMNRDELSEAIPPAYTEHVGEYLMVHLRATVAA